MKSQTSIYKLVNYHESTLNFPIPSPFSLLYVHVLDHFRGNFFSPKFPILPWFWYVYRAIRRVSEIVWIFPEIFPPEFAQTQTK